MAEIVKNLWERARDRETILYIAFGILTTIISNAAFNLCLGRGLGTGRANAVSFAAAVAFAYPTNKVFVFRSRGWGLKTVAAEAAGFVGARLFSFFFETGSLLLLIDKLGAPGYAAKLLTSVVVVILNYVFGRLIFRKSGEK